MAKKPNRTWGFLLSLGIPLAIVGVSAMAISYVTLIDVARVNGLPLPELFPILIDVGTVAAMIAAAQFRMRGLPGKWLAYMTFIALSIVSIVANGSHAWTAADMTRTTPWAAAILAATPPAALLAITHLVMLLIPDEKERARLQAARERAEALANSSEAPVVVVPRAAIPSTPASVKTKNQMIPVPAATEVVANAGATPVAPGPAPDKAEVWGQVLAYIEVEGKRPTGAIVGEWLGKSAKTGQRFLGQMEEAGAFGLDTAPVPVVRAV